MANDIIRIPVSGEREKEYFFAPDPRRPGGLRPLEVTPRTADTAVLIARTLSGLGAPTRPSAVLRLRPGNGLVHPRYA